MAEKFPEIDGTHEPTNPAIQLYGRRFYKDQTQVEYLAEFLLVFAAPKGPEKTCSFELSIGDSGGVATYWPEERLALKFFSFFPTSKLASRHVVHQAKYNESLFDIRQHIEGSDAEKDETILLLQGFFAGFVGVAKARTWVTYSFLPVSPSLLAREVTWNHPAAIVNKRKRDVSTWEGLVVYFDPSTHNFLGRGGELLFLQLANLFANFADDCPSSLFAGRTYSHLGTSPFSQLRDNLQQALKHVLVSGHKKIEDIAEFIGKSLPEIVLHKEGSRETKLGWVPKVTATEAVLFAHEMLNICASTVSSLEKLELLRSLCTLQVMRSLCFQGARVGDSSSETAGFSGNYAWVCSSPDLGPKEPLRRIAQASFSQIDELLYRALRSPMACGQGGLPVQGDLNNGDDNCFKLFRKFGKEIGLVVPRTGKGQRFVLPPHLLRFLVVALLRPGERIRLNRFFERVFAHYGIALGARQLAVALDWGGAQGGGPDYAVAADTQWIEETLRQGGLLVELSDAVSMVRNPGGRQDDR